MHYSLYLYEHLLSSNKNTTKPIDQYLVELELADISSSNILKPGPKLFDFFTFLGCSPTLFNTEQKEQSVKIHQFNKPTGLGGKSIETIRFPRCKHIIKNPNSIISDYPSKWSCQECNNSGNPDDISWRKSAGFSKTFIEIRNIFPKEAIPNDKLLETLASFTASEWGWFYSESSRAD